MDSDVRRRENSTGKFRVYCLAPIDLAYSKLAAGREKDLEFIRGLPQNKLIRQVEIQRFIAATPKPELRTNIEDRLKVALAKLKQKAGRKTWPRTRMSL